MVKGHVKWFSNPKGYGFILMDDGTEVFVHHSLVEGEGYKTLKEGEEVEFELIDSDKGKQAHKVRPTGNSLTDAVGSKATSDSATA